MYLKNTAVKVGKAAGTKAVPVDIEVYSWGGCCQCPIGVKACLGNTENQTQAFCGQFHCPAGLKGPDYRVFFKNFLRSITWTQKSAQILSLDLSSQTEYTRVPNTQIKKQNGSPQMAPCALPLPTRGTTILTSQTGLVFGREILMKVF